MTLIYSEDTSMSEIMIQIQRACMNSDFPLEVKVGPSTFKIQNVEQAKFFALGILAYISAIEERERWDR